MEELSAFRALEKTCFVLGASGETGKELLKELVRLQPFKNIVLIGRRKLEFEEDNLRNLEQRIVDFDNLDKPEHARMFEGCNHGFCSLGTTRKKEGKEGYIRVDHDYVVAAAKAAKAGGCEHFHLVSSQGADEHSMLLLTKVKGEAERDVAALNFPRCSLYRPAFLVCDRTESRPFETLFKYAIKPIEWLSPTLISIPTSLLAKGMIANAFIPGQKGVEIVDNKKIHELGHKCP
ncbi:oxidoreductase HTATIP2-like [Paramacrobiotus metropolitanus]|uniref:oxidoreductase HTATIP2-like n=1 Tax=Paramacrobiotus metropolitanus TaxID=2943436 RepID=UPI00244644AC|nr:oxidoreductase HTATIP2-like [Paramacrobiotus metropolitanus]